VHAAAKLTIFLGFSSQDKHILTLPLFSDAMFGKNRVGEMDNPIIVGFGVFTAVVTKSIFF
jgi:hypothetical protein